MLILVNRNFLGEETESFVREASARWPSLRVEAYTAPTDKRLAEADAVIGGLRPEEVKQCARLRWLQLDSAGADGFMDRAIYARPDAVLTNASGTFGAPIAEHVTAMMLLMLRGIHLYRDQQRTACWERHPERPRDFMGSAVTVLGFGDLGSEVAKRCHALGAHVTAVKMHVPSETPGYVDRIVGPEEIDGAVAGCDLLVLTLPHTEKTHHILDARRLALMKPTAYLFNVGRGGLIDQDALVAALRAGTIAGAGLDVMTPEPLPEDSPLWTMGNVLLTPHVSGFSPSNKARFARIVLDNIGRFAAGEPLRNQVDFQRQY